MVVSPTRGGYNFWRTYVVVQMMFSRGYDAAKYDWKPPKSHNEDKFLVLRNKPTFIQLWTKWNGEDQNGRALFLSNALAEMNDNLSPNFFFTERAGANMRDWKRRVMNMQDVFVDEGALLFHVSFSKAVDLLIDGKVSPESFLIWREITLEKGGEDVFKVAEENLLGGILFSKYARLLRAYRSVMAIDTASYMSQLGIRVG